MSRQARKSVAVVGAGVFGSAIALELARCGAQVTVIDNAPLGRSASGMAAGMLAPAMEAALDALSAGRFSLLAAARDLWPAFAEGIGPTGLEPCGSLLRAPEALLDDVRADLLAQGAKATVTQETLFTPDDWRLEPRLALAAMREGLQALGGRVVAGQVTGVWSGEVRLTETVFAADRIVLACGFGGQSLAPELSALTPIKGQLLRFPDVMMNDGPILRSPSGYVVPGRDGPVCGATMEEGVSDLSIDPAAVDLLQARAAGLAPNLAGARASAMAGVRAATPDGLPLVGPSSTPGLWIASGARRNGWLLAPMVARLLVLQMAGEEGGEAAALFAPGRFSLPG